MSSDHIPEGYYSEEQVAQMLDKTVNSLRADHSRSKERVPPKTRVGNRILYKKSSFEGWLEENESRPSDNRKRRGK